MCPSKFGDENMPGLRSVTPLSSLLRYSIDISALFTPCVLVSITPFSTNKVTLMEGAYTKTITHKTDVNQTLLLRYTYTTRQTMTWGRRHRTH